MDQETKKWMEDVLERLENIASAVGEIAEKLPTPPPEPKRAPTRQMNRG